MVNELAAVGDDPNELNEFGEPPLCVAAHKAQGVVVADLLQRKNIQVIFFCTKLNFVFYFYLLKIANVILEKETEQSNNIDIYKFDFV